MNEVVLCEENSWLPIPGLLTVLELHHADSIGAASII